MDNLNLYGDQRKATEGGFGVDIATQRADDLDLQCVAHIRDRVAGGSVVRALDLASGPGGQALRMAKAGAQVMAIDVNHYGTLIREAAHQEKLEIMFSKQDMRGDWWRGLEPFDVIICQRAIHYLPWHEACAVLVNIRHVLAPTGKLYLSASGLLSELGDGYQHHATDITQRFTPLSETMSAKHSIEGPVCLYTQSDMARLLESSGYHIESLFASPFGNIKAVAGYGDE